MSSGLTVRLSTRGQGTLPAWPAFPESRFCRAYARSGRPIQLNTPVPKSLTPSAACGDRILADAVPRITTAYGGTQELGLCLNTDRPSVTTRFVTKTALGEPLWWTIQARL